MQYCPHCMKPVTGGGRCPGCGGDVSWTGQKGIDLPVGTILSGGNGLRTYQIGAARGKGGFGITYIALETNSGRRMAIKEYFPTRCAFRGGNGVDVQAMTGQEEPFQSGMKSFLEEGKMLLSQDDLPCVVHVIDYFQANGTAYLVMEYLDGVALHTQMARMGGRIPVGELMPRLALLMRDIGQLHRRGVIHRDISPDNIMWMPDGGLKLLDFGSARSMESGKSMTVLMKQGFSPIEQYRSTGQGPYTDIYALAATIYYCVTGVIPPSSADRLGEDTLQSPIALGAALTVQQETALLWALSIQPGARPQSMEAFAAMLYKEGPAPAGPVLNSGSYAAPQDFRTQMVRPPQAPPQPAAGQNPGYQYGQGYAGQSAGSGQVIRQAPPQPVTERNAGYSYGQGYPGQSQYPGQYVNQPAGPIQNQPGGGKNKLPVFIGIGAGAAAVIVAAVIGVFVWLRGDGGDTVEHSNNPSQNPAATYSFVPILTDEPTLTPEPTPDIVTGTVDGFLYEIVGQDHAVLTGYEAGADFSEMPGYVNGIPITGIADGAFTGAKTGVFVMLPEALETMGANAFQDCTDLLVVGAFSNVVTDSSSFSGCTDLWFVLVDDTSVSGWNLPDGVRLYYDRMEIGYGRLKDISLSEDTALLLAETDSKDIVLLDVQPGTTYMDLDGVDWICSWALNHLDYGVTIELDENTLFPYEMYDSRDSWSAPDGALSDLWLLSCAAAWEINSARPSGAALMEPDLELVQAASTRAKEYAEFRDINNRPENKGNWETALTDQKISYRTALGSAGQNYKDYQAIRDYAAEYMAGQYAAAIEQGDFSGQYYNRIGMSIARQPDGKYVWWGFVTIA